MDELKIKGDVEIAIDYKDGRREVRNVENTILRTGRNALVKVLTNNLGDTFSFYISKINFGENGTVDGVKKYVSDGRTGLFGVTRLSKPVIATIDPNNSTRCIFSSVITFDEGVGVVFSEMGLMMASGDLYSMVTFSDLTKTSEMQINFSWSLSLI